MKSARFSPALAIGLVVVALILVLWQFVFRSRAVGDLTTESLPSSMRADPNTPQPPASGPAFARPTRPGGGSGAR